MSTLRGFEKVVAKFCVQTAVYWGSPVNDGYGGFAYADPIDIACRWEDKTEIDFGWFASGHPGNLMLSKSHLLVTQDLEEKGYLWLGTLAELETEYEDTSDPRKVRKAFMIHRFDKIPMVFKTDEFVRLVYLYDQGK
jgi:hypothetical protein